MNTSVSEVFDKIKRFHIYDHSRDEWVMSGASFPGDGCIIQHAYEDADKLTQFSSPQTIVKEADELMLVWEDGHSAEYKETTINMDTASDAIQDVIDEVAALEQVARERVKVASLSAPNQVTYFVTPAPIGDA